MRSLKLSVSGKDVDDDSDNVDDSIRSKLPSRFKRPNRKAFEKDKKNRFGYGQSKHVKLSDG